MFDFQSETLCELEMEIWRAEKLGCGGRDGRGLEASSDRPTLSDTDIHSMTCVPVPVCQMIYLYVEHHYTALCTQQYHHHTFNGSGIAI